MTDDRLGKDANRFEVHVTAEAHFAWLRTRLAVERTMMAYLRTAVSLIGFGFGIFQFVYQLQREPTISDARFPDAAWYLALALIFCGTLSAVFSVWEYRRLLRYLWSGAYAAVSGVSDERLLTPLFAMAFVIALIGLIAFAAVLLRLF